MLFAHTFIILYPIQKIAFHVKPKSLKARNEEKKRWGGIMAKGEKSGADSTRNTKKARKREAATGALPLLGGEKKHFQRIKKGVVLN